MTDANPDYLPRDNENGLTTREARILFLAHGDLVARINKALRVCRKHNNPSVNIGAHALAAKILKILEGEQ